MESPSTCVRVCIVVYRVYMVCASCERVYEQYEYMSTYVCSCAVHIYIENMCMHAYTYVLVCMCMCIVICAHVHAYVHI